MVAGMKKAPLGAFSFTKIEINSIIDLFCSLHLYYLGASATISPPVMARLAPIDQYQWKLQALTRFHQAAKKRIPVTASVINPSLRHYKIPAALPSQ